MHGKPLRGNLHGLWQVRFGSSFRIWYEIREDEGTVVLRAIKHKKEAEQFY